MTIYEPCTDPGNEGFFLYDHLFLYAICEGTYIAINALYNFGFTSYFYKLG